MEALKLRNKLIKQFNALIEDDSKLMFLDGVFDALDTPPKDSSMVPDEHYNLVEERRQKYHSGESVGTNWEELKNIIKKKHGF